MRTVLKWVGLAVPALLVLVAVAGLVASRVGAANLTAVHAVSVEPLAVPSDSAAVARGAHLAGIYGCTDCHGADLSGQVMSEEGPFRLTAPNLTPAGLGQVDAEMWDRAIRHGVGMDGTALFVMPSGAYHEMADDEAAALIAYLQTVEPVENDLPPMEFRMMGRVLAAGPLDVAAGVHPEPTTRATAPAPGATVEYGEYVAEMMCAYCHGPGLVGAEPEQPGAPYVPDLGAAGQWTPEQFHETLTTGVTPDGRQMDPEVMPWTATARMTHDEREGLRLYIASLADRRATDA